VSRIFRIDCGGEKHRVEVAERGVRFLDHDENVWLSYERAEALDALAGLPESERCTCWRVARFIRGRQYDAYHMQTTDRELRRLLAVLRGRSVGRRLRRRINVTTWPDSSEMEFQKARGSIVWDEKAHVAYLRSHADTHVVATFESVEAARAFAPKAIVREPHEGEFGRPRSGSRTKESSDDDDVGDR
jgi:hypothetical protein